MKVTQIEFEFGMTQNLGDYTNTRPSIKLVAELTEGDDPDQVLGELRHYAIGVVHNIVDNELEAAGRQVKYHTGPLYRVWYSEKRQCVVLTHSEKKPPQEENWKERDHWASHISGRDFPTNMRWETVQEAASLAQKPGWGVYDCTDGDFSDIPPLPDAGPEPIWHQKNLQTPLRHMDIDDDLWEELAELEHVTEEYLHRVRSEKYSYNYGRDSLRGEELLAFIRENRPFDTEPEPDEDDDYDDDEDWGDDDE